MSIQLGLTRNRDIYRRLFGDESLLDDLILPQTGGDALSAQGRGAYSYPDGGDESVFRLTVPETVHEPGYRRLASPDGAAAPGSRFAVPSGTDDAVDALIRRLDDDARLGPQDLGEE